MKSIYLWLVAFAVLAAGCATTYPTPLDPRTLSATDEVAYFSSEAQLSEFIADVGSSGYAPSFARTTTFNDVDMVAESAVMAVDDFGGTNNQEVGVDEADIFKTDGQYIYTVSGQTLFITSSGEDARLISSTALDMHVQGLFVDGTQLIVIGSEWNNNRYMWPGPRTSEVLIRVYDLIDRSDISLVKEIETEGWFVDARLVDGVAYIITNSGVDYATPLPVLRVDGEDFPMPVDRIAYFPGGYDDVQMTSVHTLDLASLDIASDAVLTERTQTVYMSEHLFLASTEYISEWEIRQEVTVDLAQEYLSVEDQNLIARIQQVDSDILSAQEKKSKIQQITLENIYELSQEEQDVFEDRVEAAVEEELASFEYREYTNIAKFSVDKNGIEAVAFGQVPGRVYDSFGFDEVDSVLRVVTTTNRLWENGKEVRPSENHVFTLDDELEELDSLMGLAPTESVFSARYTDDRLYLVTFEQIDPFFVIDVSDASNLAVLGELKITGFSRYLHPISENVVLGLGREANDQGRQEGLKISLFDVSDVNNPVELTKWVSDQRYARSTAEFEHKAFLVNIEKELLVIPVSSYERDNQYQGAFVFDLTTDDVELRGLVEHDQQVERSTWIGDKLYTKSYGQLRVHDIDSLESLVDIDLKQVSETDIPVY